MSEKSLDGIRDEMLRNVYTGVNADVGKVTAYKIGMKKGFDDCRKEMEKCHKRAINAMDFVMAGALAKNADNKLIALANDIEKLVTALKFYDDMDCDGSEFYVSSTGGEVARKTLDELKLRLTGKSNNAKQYRTN